MIHLLYNYLSLNFNDQTQVWNQVSWCLSVVLFKFLIESTSIESSSGKASGLGLLIFCFKIEPQVRERFQISGYVLDGEVASNVYFIFLSVKVIFF